MTFKLVIAGSQLIDDYEIVKKAIAKAVKDGFVPSSFEVVSGGAIGVDSLAKAYASDRKLSYREFLPEYRSPKDKSAPLIRNQKMAVYGDALLAIWDGKSTGTKNMMGCMETLGKPVMTYQP